MIWLTGYYCSTDKREIFNGEDSSVVLQVEIMPKTAENIQFPLSTGVFLVGQEACVSAWALGVGELRACFISSFSESD